MGVKPTPANNSSDIRLYVKLRLYEDNLCSQLLFKWHNVLSRLNILSKHQVLSTNNCMVTQIPRHIFLFKYSSYVFYATFCPMQKQSFEYLIVFRLLLLFVKQNLDNTCNCIRVIFFMKITCYHYVRINQISKPNSQ